MLLVDAAYSYFVENKDLNYNPKEYGLRITEADHRARQKLTDVLSKSMNIESV